ncbi:MAG: PP2C family protein-serine/threonine phosphatase [Desulfocapsaceae bacterium]
MRNENRLLKLLTSSLSLRIVFWVFFSVIVIETIILIPSLMRRENELLSQLKETTSATVSVTLGVADLSTTDDQLVEVLKSIRMYYDIDGGALYRYDGDLIGVFGEQPELTIDEISKDKDAYLLDRNNSSYDFAVMAERQQGKYIFIARLDSSGVKHELYAFFWRIAGLVFIISFFVTAGAWIALKPIVVSPILRLRSDLIKAGDAISNDRQAQPFYSTSVKRRDELGDVITTFTQMYQQITEAIHHRKEAEKERQISYEQIEAFSAILNNELEKGRLIQRNFFPESPSQIPGWEISTYFREARQLSGDFYDVFKLPSGSLGFVVADVCDKGVGAALFMALFRSLIRVFSVYADTEHLANRATPGTCGRIVHVSEDSLSCPLPPNALRAVELTNDYVAINHGELVMFATLFFGCLDPETGALSYINAGHEPLIVANPSGGVKALLRPTGPAIGFDASVSFKFEQLYLDRGELLLGYTDGVPDAINSEGDFYTVERLFSLLQEPVTSATSLTNRIVKAVESHTGMADQHDDITLLAIRRTP